MISILLPIYNQEKFIYKTIYSILKNTFQDYEILIINDGSTDSSVEIINKFKDNRIKVFNKKNSGLIDSLNFGLKKCSSPIVMRMDGDDIITVNKIQNQLDYFIKSRSILTGTNGYLIDSEGKKRGFIDLPTEHGQIIKSMLNMSPSIIHPSVMFYKDAVQKVGGYDSNFKHAEDYDLFLKLSSLGKLSNLNERLIYLRKHDKNISYINAKEQIMNTIISREIYSVNSTHRENQINYESCKLKVENNFLKKLFIKIHTSIVKLDNLSAINSNIKLVVLKVFRRILKKLI